MDMDIDFAEQPTGPLKISYNRLIRLGLYGAGVTAAAIVIGYFWSGRKSALEIRQIRKEEAEKAKAERQRQQMMMMGGGGFGGGGGGGLEQLAALQAGQGGGFQEADAQKIREFQNNLVMILTAANQQLSKGIYDKAAQLFHEALKIIPNNLPQYDEFALDIIPKLVTCYLELNKVDMANSFLTTIRPLLSQNPETTLAFNAVYAQILDILEKDEELESLLLDNIDRAKKLYGEKSIKYINQLYTYGTYLLKHKRTDEALAYFQICIDFHSASGGSPSQEEFGIYRQIQRCYLSNGQKDKALQVLERVKSITEDPISIGWQVHHTGTLLLEYGYEQEGNALFEELFEDFPIPEDGEFTSPRIKSLVSNTVSELAISLLNLNEKNRAEQYFQLIKDHKWGVLSSSVYLVAKSANIYFAPKENAAISFSARINCEFSLSKKVKPGMLIEFETETLEGKDGGSVVVESKQISVRFQGKEVTKIENKMYLLTAKIYSNALKSQLVFTHIQFVPSSIDTTRMKSWSEIEEGFKSKKN